MQKHKIRVNGPVQHSSYSYKQSTMKVNHTIGVIHFHCWLHYWLQVTTLYCTSVQFCCLWNFNGN